MIPAQRDLLSIFTLCGRNNLPCQLERISSYWQCQTPGCDAVAPITDRRDAIAPITRRSSQGGA
jgi:hypothetical protein